MEALQQPQINNKKIQQSSNKRKFSDLSYISEVTTNSSSCPLTANNDCEQPSAKRLQPKELFRPWLIEDNKERKHRKQTQIKPIIVQYHPNKVRTFKAKERTPKEQKRRDRNTLTCLMGRRAKKIEEQTLEQEYLEYQQQLEEVERETVKANLYLRELQRVAAAVPQTNLTAIQQLNYQSTGYPMTTMFVFRG